MATVSKTGGSQIAFVEEHQRNRRVESESRIQGLTINPLRPCTSSTTSLNLLSSGFADNLDLSALERSDLDVGWRRLSLLSSSDSPRSRYDDLHPRSNLPLPSTGC